jgi:hypothetical protein
MPRADSTEPAGEFCFAPAGIFESVEHIVRSYAMDP